MYDIKREKIMAQDVNKFETLYRLVAVSMLTIIIALVSGAWSTVSKQGDKLEITIQKLADSDKILLDRIVEHERYSEARLVRLELLVCMSYEERMKVLSALQVQLNQKQQGLKPSIQGSKPSTP